MTIEVKTKKTGVSLKEIFQGVAFSTYPLLGYSGDDGYTAAGNFYDRVSQVALVAKHEIKKAFA